MKKILQIICILAIVGMFANVSAQSVPDTVSISDIQFVSDPSIDDASPLLGDTVTVRAQVMSKPRDLWVGARWSLWVVDPDNPNDPWNGFYIIQHDTFQLQTNMQFMEPGMIVYFTGVVDEFSGLSQMNIYGQGYNPDPVIPITIESVGNAMPTPVLLTAEDLNSKANGEQWEGMWAEVKSATVVNNSIGGNWASVTDASSNITYLAEYANWFRDRLNAGSYSWPSNGTNLNVKGFIRDESGTPGQVYNINPRDTLDLELLSNPPVISEALRNIGAPTPSDNVRITANIIDNSSVQTATLYYSINEAAYQPVAMNAAGVTYSATIPAAGDGSLVRYFIESSDDVGDTSTLPGDTSRVTGQVFLYTVRQNGLTISDLQDTKGYAVDISPYNNYQVTVRGVVMTDSTDWFGDYFIQDAAAAYSGIWVNDGIFTHVKGDEVEVTAIVEEDFGVTRLNNVSSSDVVNAGVGVFPPVVLTTGEMATNGPSVEAYESVLVRFENVTVTNPFPDGASNFGEFAVNDGTGEVRADDRFSAFRGNLDSTYVQDSFMAALQGFGYFSFGNSKILPRNNDDVIGYTVGIEDDEQLIQTFRLEQNYPNPFNPSTSIRYEIVTPGAYNLSIYNVLGQKVRTLVNNFQTAKRYEALWNGLNDAGQTVGSGIYFYKLTGQGESVTKKMVLLK